MLTHAIYPLNAKGVVEGRLMHAPLAFPIGNAFWMIGFILILHKVV